MARDKNESLFSFLTRQRGANETLPESLGVTLLKQLGFMGGNPQWEDPLVAQEKAIKANSKDSFGIPHESFYAWEANKARQAEFDRQAASSMIQASMARTSAPTPTGGTNVDFGVGNVDGTLPTPGEGEFMQRYVKQKGYRTALGNWKPAQYGAVVVKGRPEFGGTAAAKAGINLAQRQAFNQYAQGLENMQQARLTQATIKDPETYLGAGRASGAAKEPKIIMVEQYDNNGILTGKVPTTPAIRDSELTLAEIPISQRKRQEIK